MPPQESVRYIFPDTNVLLECKDLRNLPWTEVASPPLQIVLTMAVIGEIDRAHYDEKSRKRENARRIKSLLRPLVTEGASEIPISGQMSIVINNALDRVWTDEMDRQHVDDQLLAEVAGFPVTSTDQKVIVTHETIMILRGRQLFPGIKTFSVPDTWLAPRKDDRTQERIRNLERKVSQLSRQQPALKLGFVNQAEEAISLVTIRPNALDTDIIQSKLKIEHKEIALSSDEITLFGSESRAVLDYNQSLQDYLEEYRDYLHKSHSFQQRSEYVFETSLYIFNEGEVPAKSLELRISSSDGIYLSREYPVVRPEPPERPKRPKVFDPSSFSLSIPDFNISNIVLPPHPQDLVRDQRAFYWGRSASYSSDSILTLTCDLFMHNNDVEVIAFFAQIDPESKGGELVATVSAANLPKRVESKLAIRVENLVPESS